MDLIVKSKISTKKKYKYSDLTFMILKDYLKKTTGKTLDILGTRKFFYRSLGMNNTSFNPLESLIKIEFRQKLYQA
jgi:5'(3')-deoxyribonucleotidase